MNDSIYTRNRVIAPILFAFSIIFAIFLLRPIYLDYIAKETAFSDTQRVLEERKKDRDALVMLSESLKTASGSNLNAKVKKLQKKWDTSNIIQTVMLNDFTKATNLTPAVIEVSNISASEGSKLPNGLYFGNVVVSIQAKSIEDIIEYVTYITTKTDYNFVLDSISLPIDTNPEEVIQTGGYGLTLQLGLYYYE